MIYLEGGKTYIYLTHILFVGPLLIYSGYIGDKISIKENEEYKKQNFDEAIRLCDQLYNNFDGRMEGYYDMWKERCEFMKTQPLPPDWNGVFVATTK